MAEFYLGRQPIFDRKAATIGYELLFRSMNSGNANVLDGDLATTDVILNAYTQLGLDAVVGNQKAFINMTRNFLSGKNPIPFSPEHVVLEILEDIALDHEMISCIMDLKNAGYTLAADDVADPETVKPILHLIDIVKLDLMAIDKKHLPEYIPYFHSQGIEVLIEKVETQEEYQRCRSLGGNYFQGYFLCKPSVIKGKRADPTRLVTLQALAKTQDPNLTFSSLSRVIINDLNLSYRLLKLVNSAYFSTTTKITSVEQAISLLGLNQTRAWLMLLIMTSTDNKPHELTRMAILRAKMCEMLSKSLGQSQSDIFFTSGLFSLMDAILDMPLGDVLDCLHISDDIQDAIVHHQGILGSILSYVIDYEQADWGNKPPVLKNISSPKVQEIYLKAIQWTDMLMGTIMNTRQIPVPPHT